MATFKANFGVFAVVSTGVIILAALVLGGGLAGGWLINWIFPSLGWGVSSILFLVTLVVMIQLLAIFLHMVNGVMASGPMQEIDEDGDEEEYEPQLLSEEQVEYVADQLSESVIARLWAESQAPAPAARHRNRSRRK